MLNRLLHVFKPVPRSQPRYPSFAMAEISDSHGFAADVYVKEISATGARFAFDSAKSVPDLIDIKIPAENIKTSGRVRWREDTSFGVEFTETLNMSGRNTSSIDTLPR